MTASVLMFGILAGLDNLRVCCSFGLLPLGARCRWQVAAAFVFCELAAPAAGLFAGKAMLSVLGSWAGILAPLITVVCGITVLATAARQDSEPLHSPLWMTLPLSLSLDNFVAGAGISPMADAALPAALMIGGISAAMSFVGLFGAAWLRTVFSPLRSARFEMAIGIYLCLLSVLLLAERSR